MTRGLIQLFAGLFLYGLSMALIVRADLGLDPWDVLNQGVFERFAKPAGVSFGLVVNLIGMAVLLLWIPLRQKPGIGTVANVLIIGTVANFGLDWIPSDLDLPLRASLLIAGIVLNGVASGAYIGAGLGPGPRDGLMTGIVARTGWPGEMGADGHRTDRHRRRLAVGRFGRSGHGALRPDHRPAGAHLPAAVHGPHEDARLSR